MKDYKLRQIVYNKIFEHDDYIADLNVDVKEMTFAEIKEYVLSYFNRDINVIQPAKSYAVAIIYSDLIQKYFNVDFFESLSDKDLFCGSDKFFIPYPEAKKLYDEILNSKFYKQSRDFEGSSLENVKKTVAYFKAEFGLNSNK